MLGNHDHESGEAHAVGRVLSDAGFHVLDGDACEIRGVGFAGTKGFGGGFGPHVLRRWGEARMKAFVAEAVEEALKLETALARITVPTRIALLHYAVVDGTVVGEPPEIYPFLGCSRLEEPLSRYPVKAVFHGHAHRGRLEARTSTGVSVYNVSLPLMRACHPERPYRIVEVTVT